MEEEMNSLQENKTWELVNLPKGRKDLQNKWVYRINHEGDEKKESYKARLVVKGFAQKEGIEFTEIFSLVIKMSSITVILGLVATLDLECEQLDVKIAFLHGELEEEIYMEQPEGFIEKGKEGLVCRFKKSLYGLKQAPQQWYKKFDSFMLEHGFQRLEVDHCVYIKRFNMKDSKLVGTPLATHFKLSTELCPRDDNEKEEMSKIPYASIIGSLMYAMVCTRPDIAYSVGVVSRFLANPRKQHWQAVKWILRYLKGTSHYCLCFGHDKTVLEGFTDVDMAGDMDTRKSTTRYLYTFAGATISCMLRLQRIVALSTIEAEYIAATKFCKEMLWMQ
eukprot:PITA_22625